MSQQLWCRSPRLPQDLFLLVELRSFSPLVHIQENMNAHTRSVRGKENYNIFSIASPYYSNSGYIPLLNCHVHIWNLNVHLPRQGWLLLKPKWDKAKEISKVRYCLIPSNSLSHLLLSHMQQVAPCFWNLWFSWNIRHHSFSLETLQCLQGNNSLQVLASDRF